MRIISKLRISKGNLSGLMNVAIVAGFVVLINLPVTTPAEPMGDMGSFIKQQLELLPGPSNMEDLGAFIESLPEDSVPVVVRDTSLSDGKFGTLSTKWKRGVRQVVTGKWCDRVMATTWSSKTIGATLQKAQAIVESNCIESAVGGDGEVSVVQVMPKTCKEIGVEGDYTKTDVALACAEAYRIRACKAEIKKRGVCSHRVMILAHNRGITGALRTANAESTEYVRKVDCAARVLRKQKCA